MEWIFVLMLLLVLKLQEVSIVARMNESQWNRFLG